MRETNFQSRNNKHQELSQFEVIKKIFLLTYQRPIPVQPQPLKVPYTSGGNSSVKRSIFLLGPWIMLIGGTILSSSEKNS